MPRVPKKYSKHGFYHVMVRGNGKQILFENDEDRRFFIERVYWCFKDGGIKLLAWCLMDNHVHLLVLDEDDTLSSAMARINIPFAQRFNSSSGHVGHVFQDRYRRKPIDDERNLLEVVRYIHNNPEQAHVCPAEKYRWSSYHEYMGAPRYTETSMVLDMLGGRRNFKRFCKERCDPAVQLSCEIDPSPETLLQIAEDALAPVRVADVASLPRAERNACLKKLSATGFSYRQIERLTGIGKSTIHYAVSKLSESEQLD